MHPSSLSQRIRLSVVAALALGSALACASGGGGSAPPVAEFGGDPDRLIQREVPAVRGPMRTVVVGPFDAIGSFTAKYGNWDIGGGIAAMLTTALQQSGRFIVVERANLDGILTEKELSGQGLTGGTSGAGVGNIIGANLMVLGAVTEFGTKDKGGGFSVGAGGGAVGNLLGSALSHQKQSGAVAIDLRIVDTTTTQVVETHTVREILEASSWDVSGGYEDISFGSNQFVKTPIGQAVRSAVEQAVMLIAAQADRVPWHAQVVDYSDGMVYVNAGSQAGLATGDRLSIERIAKTFTDPATGRVLGSTKQELGYVMLETVDAEMSYGPFIALEGLAPQRGDMVGIFER